jgi:hypothetical protein
LVIFLHSRRKVKASALFNLVRVADSTAANFWRKNSRKLGWRASHRQSGGSAMPL